MHVETKRLTLYPMSREELKKAERDLAGVVKERGADMPYIGFWEMRAKRRIYRIKGEIIEQKPRAWLITTTWLIIEKETGTLVGEAGFKGPPVAHNTVEIGYGVINDFRNKGYMTEAVDVLTRMAFAQRQYRIERITALTLPENIASHRVLEKNGYVRQPSFGKYWLWERVILPQDTAEGVFFE